LPSALARGSELRIYSHEVCRYTRTLWVTLRNVTHSLTHSDTLDSDID